jgi:nicotinamidase-related amidase
MGEAMNRLDRRRRFVRAVLVSIGLCYATASTQAQNVIDEWATAKFPPPPALKPAKIEAKETALLVMDFTNQTCTQQRRPRCANQIPKVVALVSEARQNGALIVYSVAVPGSVATDIVKELTPAAGETVLPPLGPDKFIGSELEKSLKERGIKTVVAMGTQAQTSVLHTGGSAALRGFKVIVPVDAMSADDVFPEAYTAWHLATAARISTQVTLTRLDMISF